MTENLRKSHKLKRGTDYNMMNIKDKNRNSITVESRIMEILHTSNN